MRAINELDVVEPACAGGRAGQDRFFSIRGADDDGFVRRALSGDGPPVALGIRPAAQDKLVAGLKGVGQVLEFLLRIRGRRMDFVRCAKAVGA